LLGSVEDDGAIVVADLEAGMGTLTRLGDGPLDHVLVVVEPTAKALEAGRRLAGLADEHRLGDIVVVANRVASADDGTRVHAAFPDRRIVLVPDDPAIGEADRDGVAPLDRRPDSPAVRALSSLAELLAP
jgi:CO dehydrogenase maturation factor